MLLSGFGRFRQTHKPPSPAFPPHSQPTTTSQDSNDNTIDLKRIKMARPSATPRPRFAPNIKPQPHLMGVTSSVLSRWAPILGIWGAGGAAFVTLAASAIPRFQEDVLKKIPGVASYYESTVPDCDKPF
ncbi:uncharacterized protein PGTG_17541 [Puccinia graminis f. sp. tritici CRL 75-36-700-3]|uniref:Ubiquinol-cytochrome c reductase subunit 10 n=1 Tax=Puccinia graminis f. sp. tritici (strain CRL 75-36-700-3 / race SCCL) TaxID=418459 RepID=E3L560_PUCGT|nr:uncharacterized protein PGTG_17541 [Puccinia graminis f. sp. tritici CRL 75-36-700-3]EFP91685.2 hypothetical protein PGTG_17541 [Puccinia graminis f. sp. tritici CRL 75-36-700-3]